MNDETTIRRATLEDVPAVAEMWKELMDWLAQYDGQYQRTPDGHEAVSGVIADCINANNSAVFMAEIGKTVVGYCICHVGKYPSWTTYAGRRNASISDMAVTQKARRKGIGAGLLAAAKEWFATHNVRHIKVMSIHAQNEAAMSFWRSMGFRPSSETLALEI